MGQPATRRWRSHSAANGYTSGKTNPPPEMSFILYPCPYQSATSLGVAFGSATFLSTSDTIKSQMDFATYYENFGWFGQLGSLTPGEGYKMKLIAGGGMAFPDV